MKLLFTQNKGGCLPLKNSWNVLGYNWTIILSEWEGSVGKGSQLLDSGAFKL